MIVQRVIDGKRTTFDEAETHADWFVQHPVVLLAQADVPLTCRRCSLTLADHVLGGEPADMEALGFNAAEFGFDVPRGAWCLIGLGNPEPTLEVVGG